MITKMTDKIIYIFNLIFISFIVIKFEINALSANIDFKVYGEGFHRILKYQINTGAFQDNSCHIAVSLNLPSSLYVNTDELAELRRLKRGTSCINGEIDVELFAEKAKPQTVSICSRLISNITTFNIPIHQRYFLPHKSESFKNVSIPQPKLLIGCKENLKELRVSKIFLCKTCILYSKKWRDFPFKWKNEDFVWNIPIGNTTYSSYITYITILITNVGAGFVFYAIWNTSELANKMK